MVRATHHMGSDGSSVEGWKHLDSIICPFAAALGASGQQAALNERPDDKNPSPALGHKVREDGPPEASLLPTLRTSCCAIVVPLSSELLFDKLLAARAVNHAAQTSSATFYTAQFAHRI